MFRKIIAAVLAIGILGMCGGCRQKKGSLRIVEQISAQWEERETCVCLVFEEPEKMQLILNRFRTLGQRFAADADPDTLDATTVTVTLLYSDGVQKQYRIKPDRYIQIGQAPWQQASPRAVTALRLLLQSLPADSKTCIPSSGVL